MRTATIAFLAALAGCGGIGRVNQGQVVAYQREQGLITLVADSNYRDPSHPRFDVLPAITIRQPGDPREMGPEPEPGKLLDLDTANRRAVIFDPATHGLRTVPFTLVSEQHGVAPTDARVHKVRFPLRDPSKGAITVYWARARMLVEFSVPEEFRNLPDDSWRAGDVVRYYYKNAWRALRLMNVTKTDLSKAGK